MKKLFCLIIPISLLVSCVKSEKQKCDDITITAPASEVATLRSYLDTNHITYTADPRGFFYHMDSVGTGGGP